MNKQKLYLALYTIHGLVRGSNIELGRDADTGGQITYVVELAKALGEHPDIEQVDVFTRLIEDTKVDPQYGVEREVLSNTVNIIRLPFGPRRRYLRKEVLWPYLESLVDQSLQYFRRTKRIPDLIHGHYADAGYVGAMLSYLLEVPFVFTGHSLGREKLRRLQEKGQTQKIIRETYHIDTRIEAEETALNASTFVVASTRQEVEQQYQSYDHYIPERMRVIPPGVDISRFTPFNQTGGDPVLLDYEAQVRDKLTPFLRDPDKPIILALSRADERKNIPMLIKAYGEAPDLQARANLVIIAGNRDDIRDLDKGARTVMQTVVQDIDRYDLYGKVAYPKHHSSDEVPAFYRVTAASGGLFVNPALTEPFGLTLLEAAASGLPIVATNDGGPRDIIRNCANGVLVDPLDSKAIADALMNALANKKQWREWSESGLKGVNSLYTWQSHVDSYMEVVHRFTDFFKPTVSVNLRGRRRFSQAHKLFVTDVDNTLIGDADALKALFEYTEAAGDKLLFAVATGRRLGSALAELEKWNIPEPDFLIASVGTEIYSGSKRVLDTSWRKHINYRWEPDKIRKEIARAFRGIELQPDIDQREFKISYIMTDPKIAPSKAKIMRHLRQKRLLANVVFSLGQFIDIIPIRASKGLAVRQLAFRWGLPMENIVVAGDSGNDEDMLKGDTYGIVVKNYSPEIEKLRDVSTKIYFAEQERAKGILEGLQHFGFLDDLLGE
jgi:sucrose-phosphate synthase